jgi:hypothetical protein
MSAASVVSMALAGVFADLIVVRVAFLPAGIVVGVAVVAAALLFRGPGSHRLRVRVPAAGGVDPAEHVGAAAASVETPARGFAPARSDDVAAVGAGVSTAPEASIPSAEHAPAA